MFAASQQVKQQSTLLSNTVTSATSQPLSPSSPYPTSPTSPTNTHRGPQGDVAQYVKRHHIHLLLDQLVKDILVEKPKDCNSWMLRWFLERHRLACEERHIRSSPQPSQKMGSGARGSQLSMSATSSNSPQKGSLEQSRLETDQRDLSTTTYHREESRGPGDMYDEENFKASPELSADANEADQQLMAAVVRSKQDRLQASPHEQLQREILQNQLRSGHEMAKALADVGLPRSSASNTPTKAGTKAGAGDLINRKLDMAQEEA